MILAMGGNVGYIGIVKIIDISHIGLFNENVGARWAIVPELEIYYAQLGP